MRTKAMNFPAKEARVFGVGGGGFPTKDLSNEVHKNTIINLKYLYHDNI
jgi:hypothetical protein